MKKTMVVLTLFFAIGCMAQNVPSAVKNSFAKNFAGITVKKWDKEDEKFEANFTKDGKSMSATFTADGSLEETETDIKITELPAAVLNYIKANYKGATIKEAAIIEKPGSEKMFEAEVKGKDLLFNGAGKFLREEED